MARVMVKVSIIRVDVRIMVRVSKCSVTSLMRSVAVASRPRPSECIHSIIPHQYIIMHILSFYFLPRLYMCAAI